MLTEEKRIHANNIFETTRRHAYNPEKIKNPSTLKELITKTKKELQENIAFLERQYNKAAVEKAKKKLEDFETITSSKPPVGFKLAVIVFSETDNNYSTNKSNHAFKIAKTKISKLVAEQHVDELKALGICDYGINEMRFGSPICNEQGILYDLDWDHIIEQKYCGNFYAHNLSNIMLLPRQIHELKNDLRICQEPLNSSQEKEGFTIALIPKAPKPGFSGCVAPAQTEKKYKLKLYNIHTGTCLYQISHALDKAARYAHKSKRIKASELDKTLSLSQKSIKDAFNNAKAAKIRLKKKHLVEIFTARQIPLLCNKLSKINTEAANHLNQAIKDVQIQILQINKKKYLRNRQNSGNNPPIII